MIIHRTIPQPRATAVSGAVASTASKSPLGAASECHAAMLRHHDRLRAEKEALEPLPPSPPPTTAAAPLLGSQAGGDILYGARAIALYIFPDDYEHEPRRTRRRVFNLWSHYRDRQAKAGFFKLKGALCLSKTQWRAFHRLD